MLILGQVQGHHQSVQIVRGRDQFQGQDVFQEILTQVILLTQGQDQGHQITDEPVEADHVKSEDKDDKRKEKKENNNKLKRGELFMWGKFQMITRERNFTLGSKDLEK